MGLSGFQRSLVDLLFLKCSDLIGQSFNNDYSTRQYTDRNSQMIDIYCSPVDIFNEFVHSNNSKSSCLIDSLMTERTNSSDANL